MARLRRHLDHRFEPAHLSLRPSLVRRRPDSTATSSESGSASATTNRCAHSNKGVCQHNASTTSTTTLPVALAVCIPVAIALILIFVFHRRNVRKLRREDAMDRKSLDYGLDFVPDRPAKGKKGRKAATDDRDMSIIDTEKTLPQQTRGVSLDLDMPNPYLLPPDLNNSRASITSLAHSASADDKYRPATALSRDSLVSGMSPIAPASSAFPTSPSPAHLKSMSPISPHPIQDPPPVMSDGDVPTGDESKTGLLANAQRMSASSPPRASPTSVLDVPGSRTSEAVRQSNNYLAAMISDESPAMLVEEPAPEPQQEREPGKQSTFDAEGWRLPDELALPESPVTLTRPVSGIGNDNTTVKPLPPITASQRASHLSDARHSFDNTARNLSAARQSEIRGSLAPGAALESLLATEDPSRNSLNPEALHPSHAPRQSLLDPRRSTMGLRPLPPEDPSDNPEQRASRIRSFYKEYFDESKNNPNQMSMTLDGNYFGHDEGYYGPPDVDDGYYGRPPMRPFAQPIGRRAITPPPRMPGYGPAGGPRPMSPMSSGRPPPPRPGAFSSASGRMPRGPPKKRAPPPAPLHVLPTPHKLTDEMMMLPSIDFAPDDGIRGRREGRPSTPQGGLRPYSPSLPAVNSLHSAFDELAVLPSPHALRKSGTFTALDFAPPPKINDPAGPGSDAGSMRSGHSGRSGALSPVHHHNIRSGKYRVSRLPDDTVGTVDDMSVSLKPRWDMNR